MAKIKGCSDGLSLRASAKNLLLWAVTILSFGALASICALADDPTSRYISLTPLAASATNPLPAGSTGNAVQFEVWDAATGGTQISVEAHTVDTDANSNITNDTGFADLLLGRPGGLNAANYPPGTSRYFDVTQNGASVIAARIPLYASAFTVSPGPPGPPGPQGSQGPQGPPGPVQSVSAGDGSIAVGGTAANPMVAVAPNGITDSKIADGAINPLKIRGTAAVLAFADVFQSNIGIQGNLGLPNTQTNGAGIIIFGGNRFVHNFGSANTFVGQNAGNNTVLQTATANNNVGVGTNALSAATTGCCNSAVGNNALWQNNTGGGNTAVGDGALYSNSSGGNNTAIGRVALISNSTGSYNTATGVSALQNNSAVNGIVGSASYNTATGYQALFSNTTGGYNTGTGYQALYNNTEGYFNTASGPYAMQTNSTGSANTAQGYGALGGNTSGGDNTAMGRNALGNSSTGSYNTALGSSALSHNGTGANNTGLGALTDVSGTLTNATAIGYGAIVNASNKIRLGNTAVMVIEGNVQYSFSSDKNRKENFQPVNGEAVLGKIARLPVSTWNYIGQDPKRFRHYGPVAQDFFAAFGHDRVGTIGTDTTIGSGDLEGVLLIGVQALERHARKLEQENGALRSEMRKLSKDDAELRATIQRISAENRQSRQQLQKLLRQVNALAERLVTTRAVTQPAL